MPEPEDYETPTLLSESQLDAKAEAVVKALTALGLTARLSSKPYCNSHEIQVEEIESGQDAILYLDAEGGASWDIWGETPYERHTTVQDITTAINGRLRAPLAAND